MKNPSTPSYSSSFPSSSSSSSSTTTMCNSKNSTGCFSAILRRILCSGGLPTHPSDQIRELDPNPILGTTKDQNFNPKNHSKAIATTTSSTSSSTTTVTTTIAPGIVARLMGLDSIPSKNSLSRSRSMNSVDCLGECNRIGGDDDDGVYKKVKSTLSFRELPTFLLLENDNFLVLTFEKAEKGGRKGKMGCAELKQREKREKVYDGGDEKKGKKTSQMGKSVGINGGKLQDITNINTSSCSSQFKAYACDGKKCFDSEERYLSRAIMNRKEGLAGEKMKRRRRRRRNRKRTNCFTEKNMEGVECKPEDSSPVSVLHFEREPCGTVGLSSRRKLSQELENDQQLPLRSDADLMAEENKVKEIKNNKIEGLEKKFEGSKRGQMNIWGQVCRLAQDEFGGTIKGHAWMDYKQDELGSISEDFESEIFDQLLNEVIDQLLVGHHPVTTLQLS